MVASGIFFLSTTSIEEISLGLIKLGIPYSVSFVLSTALRLVPTFIGTGATVIEAQRSRGLDLDSGNVWQKAKKHIPLLVPIFLLAIRNTDQLAVALESRGFGSREKRTYYLKIGFKNSDYVFIFILVFIIRYMLLIYKEEKKLLSIFADKYHEYCKKVPRIFPSLLSMIRLDISDYLPIKLIWFKKEIGSILTLLALVLLIESWEDIAREGWRIYFGQFLWLFLTLIFFMMFIILLSKLTNKKNANGSAKS